jgi:hypothetical protein
VCGEAGTCEAITLAAAGERCEPLSASSLAPGHPLCDASSSCGRDGVCERNAAFGEPCGPKQACRVGLRCRDGVCGRAGNDPEECTL